MEWLSGIAAVLAFGLFMVWQELRAISKQLSLLITDGEKANGLLWNIDARLTLIQSARDK